MSCGLLGGVLSAGEENGDVEKVSQINCGIKVSKSNFLNEYQRSVAVDGAVYSVGWWWWLAMAFAIISKR